jgi:hypothetical protein
MKVIPSSLADSAIATLAMALPARAADALLRGTIASASGDRLYRRDRQLLESWNEGSTPEFPLGLLAISAILRE